MCAGRICIKREWIKKPVHWKTIGHEDNDFNDDEMISYICNNCGHIHSENSLTKEKKLVYYK